LSSSLWWAARKGINEDPFGNSRKDSFPKYFVAARLNAVMCTCTSDDDKTLASLQTMVVWRGRLLLVMLLLLPLQQY
jgi:hypothetical protein